MTGVRTYRYQAYTPSGHLAEGSLQAKSLDSAMEALWSRGLTPFEAHEDVETAPNHLRHSFVQSWNKPSLTEIAMFTREFSTLIESSIPLDEALRIVADQLEVKRVRAIVEKLLQSILDGLNLSEAMGRYPRVFHSDYINMVRAGEARGDLAPVLGELADLLEQRVEIGERITSALLYPCVLILLAVASIGVVVGILVPNLVPVFNESNRQLPVLIAFSIWLVGAWPWIVGGGVVFLMGALAVVFAGLRSTAVRSTADRLVLSLPVVGPLIAKTAIASFCRTLGLLLRGGVPMLAALTSACLVVRNNYIASGLEASIDAVREGQNLGRALTGRAGITPVCLRMIAVGEETRRLDHMLIRIATIFERQTRQRIERLMTLLTPALTIAIAAFVGALIFTVMNAILSANELAVR